MEDKHPIDKLFRDALKAPDIPVDKKAWNALERKMHPRKRQPLVIWIGSGIAAALVIAAILLFGVREQPADHSTYVDTLQPRPAVSPGPDHVIPHDTNSTSTDQQTTTPVSSDHPGSAQVAVNTQLPVRGPDTPPPTPMQTIRLRSSVSGLSSSLTSAPHAVAVWNGVALTARPSAKDSHAAAEVNTIFQRGWTLGILAAPDLSGTSPLGGKLGGNAGLMVTYQLNDRLSLTGGILYAKKLYQTEFANYQAPSYGSNSKPSHIFVDADCNVLDIPLMVNVDLIKRPRSTWFVAAGASSYFMLSETYDYSYPPHEYGYPKRLTVRNENRHILGVGNLSIGYRRKLSPGVSISIQPFVKVPLTGIGNGNLKLYSSGVALSADIRLMRRAN